MAEQTEDPVKVGTEAPNLAYITPVEGLDVASLAGNTDAMLMQSWQSVSASFGKLLVCYKVRLMLTESIEKHFLAIFWGSNIILTGLRGEH